MFHFLTVLTGSAAIAAGAWIYLITARGSFWRAEPRLDHSDSNIAPPQDRPPSVVAVVPARNEAAGIATSLRTLFAQDYPGPFRIVLVDDSSDDGTAALALETANAADARERLDILTGAPLPSGWTGKMWAVAQGIRHASTRDPEFIWLTDADIAHHPSELRDLVRIAEADNRNLVSLMVKLRCQSFWEKLLIPAFVFFFQMLFPFRWVNDRAKSTAAAAGGSMLVRMRTLVNAGSIEAIKNAVIDDCALARSLKPHGAIWVGLTEETQSIRPYDGLGEIWEMVARSAYAQLNYSPLLLFGSMIGLVIVYASPPAAFFVGASDGNFLAAWFGLSAWLVMAAAYSPTLSLYGLRRRTAIFLPLICLLYCAMTLNSALRHYRGRGGGWKGRVYAGYSGPDIADAPQINGPKP